MIGDAIAEFDRALAVIGVLQIAEARVTLKVQIFQRATVAFWLQTRLPPLRTPRLS